MHHRDNAPLELMYQYRRRGNDEVSVLMQQHSSSSLLLQLVELDLTLV